MKVVCISHREDPDGLICAAYLYFLKGASILLVGYDELETVLKNIKSPVRELYICDLHIREDLIKEVIRVSDFAHVTIVDHHPIAIETLDRFAHLGVTLVYSSLDCASVLLYDHFKEKLERDAARLAAYAAVSDQFEEGPIASELLSKFDRQLIQHEALILTHALHNKAAINFKLLIVKELSKFTFPHRIEGVTEAALAQLEETTKLIKILPSKAVKRGRLAYIEISDRTSLGAMASLVLDAIDVDVGISYKRRGEEAVNISIRGRKGLELHLGEVSQRLAKKYGGFGGGHKKASGAQISKENILRFINAFEIELMKSTVSNIKM